MINFLISAINQRKVDKPLTADREDDLRQAGATDDLIAAIKTNSPPLQKPIETPSPTPKPDRLCGKVVFLRSPTLCDTTAL